MGGHGAGGGKLGGIVWGKSFAIFLFYFVKEERRMSMERRQCCGMTGRLCLIRVKKETEKRKGRGGLLGPMIGQIGYQDFLER